MIQGDKYQRAPFSEVCLTAYSGGNKGMDFSGSHGIRALSRAWSISLRLVALFQDFGSGTEIPWDVGRGLACGKFSARQLSSRQSGRVSA